MSEESKKKKESGWTVSRRKFVEGATTGIVGAALAGMGVTPKPAVADVAPELGGGNFWCPEISQIQIIGICGSKGCTAVIKFPDGHTEPLDLSGSGGLDTESSGATVPFKFKHMFGGKQGQGVGRIKVKLQSGQPSTGTAGQAFINGQWRNTITAVNLKQTFEFPDANDGAGYTTSPGALNMGLNVSNSSDTSLQFNAGSGSLPMTLVPAGPGQSQGVTLESYNISVSARPKSAGGSHLLTLTDIVRTSSQLQFKVRLHSDVTSLDEGAEVGWWAHNPDNHSDNFPHGDVEWATTSPYVSTLITVNLNSYSAVNAAAAIAVEAASRGDSRKLFNFTTVAVNG